MNGICFNLSSSVSAKSLLNELGLKSILIGDDSIVLDKVCSLGEPNFQAISFCKSITNKNIERINKFEASLFLVSEAEIDLAIECSKKNLYAFVANPRLSFVRALNYLFEKRKNSEIHHSCLISPNAKIASNVQIGAFSVIGDCVIGEGSVIGNNVCLRDGVILGRNVVIKSGAIIGEDGFGYEKNEKSIYEKFPHLGGVVIEDNVHIGANTCIDRGVLGNTIIKSNTKIDNLVHIAHNVQLGNNNMVVALSEISGSATIEDNVWIAPGVKILDKVTVGANSFLGIGALVTKDVPPNHRVIPAFSTTKPPKNI